jgi:hypothetical protein
MGGKSVPAYEWEELDVQLLLEPGDSSPRLSIQIGPELFEHNLRYFIFGEGAECGHLQIEKSRRGTVRLLIRSVGRGWLTHRRQLPAPFKFTVKVLIQRGIECYKDQKDAVKVMKDAIRAMESPDYAGRI